METRHFEKFWGRVRSEKFEQACVCCHVCGVCGFAREGVRYAYLVLMAEDTDHYLTKMRMKFKDELLVLTIIV